MNKELDGYNKSTQHSLSLENVSSGVYYVQVLVADKIYYKKIIVN